jgi:hypothetical protein
MPKKIKRMEQTAGVTIERNAQGIASYVRIDLQKYGERLMPFFREIGVEVKASPYSPEFVSKIRQSEEQISGGKFKIVKTEDLWK